MNITSSFSQNLQFLSLESNRLPSEPVVENTGSVLKPITELHQASASVSYSKPSPSQNPSKSSTGSEDPSESLAEQDPKQAKQEQQNALRLEQLEQQQVQQLAARDREVRNHERAHAAVGGQYASAPKYQFERGPDGINYAVSGEVSIQAGGVSGDPAATIEKAQIIRRAALAPAEPSSQDRKVAAEAAQMESRARVELANVLREEREAKLEVQEQNKIDDSPRPTSDNLASRSVIDDSVVVDSDKGIQGAPAASDFLNLQTSLNNVITSSNANGKYLEPGNLFSSRA